jgi:hypothetical protein
MTSITSIAIDRLASALGRHGVRMKRMKLLQSVSEALGYRNVHEFEAAARDDGMRPPEARYMGRTRVDRIGWMHFFQDPDGTVFAVDQDRFDAQEGSAADWIASPLGGLLDVSALRRPATSSGEAAVDPAPGSMYLGRPITPFTNMCTEIVIPHEGRLPIDPLNPAYMTNGCCEVATVTQGDMEALGLRFGEFDGSFYPLTDKESGYIAEDVVDADDGIHGALIGYSVLYRSAKYLMPTIEVQHSGPLAPDLPSRTQVHAEATDYANRIMPKVADLGGEVLVDAGMEDRICIQILVPLDRAMDVGDFEAWKERLAWLMVDPELPTVLQGEIVHTGREFQVSLCWLGEGKEGDYDPMEPYDHPLVRFDVRRLVDGEWEDVDAGSYCTQVPAYAGRTLLVALARMLTETLDVAGGSYPKRLMEGLSWTDLDKVRAAQAEQAGLDAIGADVFVAEATYGNPDQGTSLSLRRRADGSVRCEVYADLDCVALLDTHGGMGEVRDWLRTLPGDIENAEGPNHPAVALAPQWADFERNGRDGVRWMLVPEGESETEWFAEVPPAAPFERRFVSIGEMDV